MSPTWAKLHDMMMALLHELAFGEFGVREGARGNLINSWYSGNRERMVEEAAAECVLDEIRVSDEEAERVAEEIWLQIKSDWAGVIEDPHHDNKSHRIESMAKIVQRELNAK